MNKASWALHCHDNFWQNRVNIGQFILKSVKLLAILSYLQFLHIIGMYQSKKTWIDKNILWCYNRAIELNYNALDLDNYIKK